MLMRTDELYKFSNRTLTSVRTVLHDIALNLRMDYLPKKRWSSLDRKRSHIMMKAIDHSHHGPSDAMHNPSQALKSDTKVFTMTTEILPEPTSNKLCGNPDGGSSWFKTSQDS
ncbi:hypothetical protein Tco_1157637 [Tanacetum coccineum]